MSATTTSAGAHPSGDNRFRLPDHATPKGHTSGSALVEVLQVAQGIFGYLENDPLIYIARALRLPLSRVYGVATFYRYLRPQTREHRGADGVGDSQALARAVTWMQPAEVVEEIRRSDLRGRGANQGFDYVRDECPLAIERLHHGQRRNDRHGFDVNYGRRCEALHGVLDGRIVRDVHSLPRRDRQR